jgi:hypothetical protein
MEYWEFPCWAILFFWFTMELRIKFTTSSKLHKPLTTNQSLTTGSILFKVICFSFNFSLYMWVCYNLFNISFFGCPFFSFFLRRSLIKIVSFDLYIFGLNSVLVPLFYKMRNFNRSILQNAQFLSPYFVLCDFGSLFWKI